MSADSSAARAATPAVATPSVLEAARRIAPLVRENAAKIDADRELPKPVFHALADAGIYLMAVPRAVGGLEIDFPIYLQVIEELGKADASTAWTVSQNANWATYSARMSREAAREIWIDTPRSVVSNTPGASREGGRGAGRLSRHRPAAVQHRLHARFVDGGARAGDRKRRGAAPERQARSALLPACHARRSRSSTRGTPGECAAPEPNTFEVKDVFVPEERTVFPYGAPLVSPGPRYKIPLTLGFGAGDGMVALGLARNCIDAFFEVAGRSPPRNMHGLLRDQAISQFSVGQAEADLRCARARALP